MRRLVRDQAGFTLVELIAVMAILGIVLIGLTTTLASGYRSQVDLNRRFQAQQEARLAADRMRREIHCADGLTLGSPSSVTVYLPGPCPTAGGSDIQVVYDTQLVSTGRYRLRRASVVVADYLTTGNVFSYIAPSSSSLGKLHVSLPVDLTPGDNVAAWKLETDLVLRNTERA
jgi:prepilin-type N-terminal cleavage/methylation domain-containing protein